MASGKSSIGRHLSKIMDRELVDLDQLIEEKHSKSIGEIFEEFGQDRFREIESEALLETKELRNHIVSTGGGTPCFFDNMDWIKSNGISVYLHMDEERVLGRLRKKKEKRPLVANLSDDELRDFIYKSLAERKVFYEQADYIISNAGESKRMLAKKIVGLMEY